MNLIEHSLQEALTELQEFIANPATVDKISAAAKMMAESLCNGNKIISCGNGGSLCDATHFAEELTGRYRGNRRSLPAVAINDPAYMTCTGNDFDFDSIFSRYIEGVGQSGDCLLGFSTSGNSANIIKAVDAAKNKGMKTIVLTSAGGNRLSQIADIAIEAPKAAHSDRIQEIHIKVIHILIQIIEAKLGFENC